MLNSASCVLSPEQPCSAQCLSDSFT
uniref:Uncharacterized protein n=1 Tax=Arundo donax TaxID=35708 RepID=A0A0A9AEW8_ARUDO